MSNEEDTLVLPCAPSDEEKLSYLKANRTIIYAFGVFSFICINIGIILFIHSSYYFLVLLPFGLYQFFYLSFSYVIGLFGRDFDYKWHQEQFARPEVKSYKPSVDIYLPSCGEPMEILNNTYTYVNQIVYPNYKVYVLDDKDRKEVKELAAAFGFNYIVRNNRPHLKKAGNIRYAFQHTSGDLFTIFDADFCPRHDFLQETVPYFYIFPEVAVLQTPQFFRVREEQTWVEKGAGSVQELFYRLIQVNRNRFQASICVGTSAVYRREALVPFG